MSDFVPPPPPPSSSQQHHGSGGRSRQNIEHQFHSPGSNDNNNNNNNNNASAAVPPPPPPPPKNTTSSSPEHSDHGRRVHHPHAHFVENSDSNNNNNNNNNSIPPPPTTNHAHIIGVPQHDSDGEDFQNDSDEDEQTRKTSSTGKGGGGKKRQLIRRRGSFQKLTTLSTVIENWFYTDPALHSAWCVFAKTVPKNLVSVAYTSNSAIIDSTMFSASLAAQEQQEEFCEIFEQHLDQLLEKQGVTTEQFMERVRLDKEEEERDGSHFYRWLEVIEFPAFVDLLTPSEKQVRDHEGDIGKAGIENMLHGIKKMSESARSKFRRQSILGPLLTSWTPPNFKAFDVAVQSAIKTGHITNLGLSRTDMKSMLRWKQRLATPKMNEQGFYDSTSTAAQPEELLIYLSALTTGMEEAVFDTFIEHLRHNVKDATLRDNQRLEELRGIMNEVEATTSSGTNDGTQLVGKYEYSDILASQETLKNNNKQQQQHKNNVDASSSSSSSSSSVLLPQQVKIQFVQETETLMITIEQRALLEFFFELDVRHQGKIPLTSALKLMVQTGAMHERDIKKVLLRHKYWSQKQPTQIWIEKQEEEILQRSKSSLSSDGGGGGLSRNTSAVGEIMRRRSSVSDSFFGDPHSSTGGGEGSAEHQQEHAEHQQSSATATAEGIEEEDPPVNFKLFVSVVREPLRATFRERTVRKLCPKSDSCLKPMFEHHDKFLETVHLLRKVWRDKQ